MTTSFAHFVRGQFLESLRSNAAGFWLAACCLAQIPWCCKIALTGRYRSVYSPSDILLLILSSVTLVALVHWGIKLLI
jgi:hypothetical protein